MSYRAPHQSPLEALGGPGAPACACCARRAGVGGARGARLLPAHARIPRGARDPRVRASLHPLRAPRGAPRGLRTPKTPKAQSRARGARRVGAGRSHGLWPPPAPMRIPPRAVPILVRHDRAPHGASGGTHSYIVDPPSPGTYAPRARGARREWASRSYGPWLSPTPTKISRRARHRGKHLLRAPHGAPGRVHQTPLRPWVRV